MALVFVNRLMSLVMPASGKVLIDDVILGGRHDWLVWIALAVLGAALAQGATAFSLTRLIGIAAQRTINDLRRRLQRHLGRLPVSFFDREKTGALITRVIQDAEGIRNIIGTGLIHLINGIVTALLALGILTVVSWRLTLVTLIAMGIYLAVTAWGLQRVRPLFRERRRLTADMSGRLNEFLSGIRIVKAYRAEKREEIIFARQTHQLFRVVAQSMTGVSLMAAFSTVFLGVMGTAMIMIGGREVIAGRLTEGDLLMFVAYIALIINPLVQISQVGTRLSDALAGLDRVRELLAVPVEDLDETAKEPLGAVVGRVEFDSVWFEYVADLPVLKNVDLLAQPGTTTALVGPSGSGKSTLISLVMAFSHPKRGRVLIDGRDLRALRSGEYRQHLGVVLQENFLFDGTLAENIAYGNPKASREQIEEVGRIAHCDEFVERLEKGYDTVVGERGVRLSGGQRQRAAIARAILADPRILILDEATSSLDSESEALIQDGLARLREGRTTFVIAHRLSTIRNADQILVLDRGEIVERGTHKELLACGGRYRALYERQYRIERDRFINPGEEFEFESPPAPIAGDPDHGLDEEPSVEEDPLRSSSEI
jgi:subfamily B ATP-binding cassette protein MsbA